MWTPDGAANGLAALKQPSISADYPNRIIVCAAHQLQRCVIYGLGLNKLQTSAAVAHGGDDQSEDDDAVTDGAPEALAFDPHEAGQHADHVEEIRSFLASVRAMVAYFRNSPEQMKKLRATTLSLDDESQTWARPQSDVVTRWWSTLTMLRSVLTLRQPILAFWEMDHRGNPPDFSKRLEDRVWPKLFALECVLEPLGAAVKELEGEKYLTYNLLVPTVQHMRKLYVEGSSPFWCSQAAFGVHADGKTWDRDRAKKSKAKLCESFPFLEGFFAVVVSPALIVSVFCGRQASLSP